jgi:hypothetical protein
MSDKPYPSNLYLESAATNLEFAKRVSAEAVAVMAKELLSLRPCRHNWSVIRLVECGGRYQCCVLCGAKKVAA